MTNRETNENADIRLGQQNQTSSCGRVPVSWSRTDTSLLTCLLIGVCALIITISVIWSSYLQTADYHRGQCLVLDVQFVGPRQCTSGSATCAINISPAHNFSFISSTVTGQPNDNDTVTSHRIRPDMATDDVLSLCASFPCYQVAVEYAITTSGFLLTDTGQLYSSYAQLRAYPGCTYSACDGADYSENEAVISSLVEGVEGQTFTCYVNMEDEFVSRQPVLEDISYTSSVAINSVLWPGVFSAVCLLALICHVIWSSCPSCRSRLFRTKYTATSAATASSESELRQSNMAAMTHRRHVPVTSCQSQNAGSALYNVYDQQLNLTNLTGDGSPVIWFTPPPYDLVVTSSDTMTTAFSSIDPPAYQETVLATADGDMADPAGYF